ncbi:MAG: hypothetical protein OXI62_13320 [Chloroflexota bacterium]|nr:hypothetical protein [Chloroflexota bacterium]
MHSNFSGMSLNSFIAALLAWLLTIAAVLPSSAQTSERPAGWTDESHGNRAPANYAVVLPDDRINELYITFTPESWADQEADMTKIYGERGAAGTGFGSHWRRARHPATDAWAHRGSCRCARPQRRASDRGDAANARL